MDRSEPTPNPTPPLNTPNSGQPNLAAIPSVNDRGGASGNWLGKVIFIAAVGSVVLIGGMVTYSRLTAAEKSRKTEAAAAAKSENKPAAVPERRRFATDHGQGAEGSTSGPTLTASDAAEPCLTQPCANDGYVVPALDPAANGAPPLPGSGTSRVVAYSSTPNPIAGVSARPRNTRYDGDVLLSGARSGGSQGTSQGAGQSSLGAADLIDNPLLMMALAQGMNGQGAQGAPPAVARESKSPAGSVGSLLQASDTPRARASKLGDRNMVLAKGRTIECAMSMRIISEIAGLTSCVLSQNVYSDNGRVILLERGSEAVGEYRASMEQGQRRLFVIWSRIKTPSGVVISLDSPGADALGTAGLTGKVDNHWWQRVGGAFLISTVKDAVAYQLAEKAGNNPGGAVIYQSTQATGDQLAQRVLESTINIRPTLYVGQGDRASIYVARDLDFGDVYELRAR